MLPAIFVSHGSPMIALERDGEFARALRRFGAARRPRAVVVVSAHWQTPDVRVTATPKLIYDFGGFPEKLYSIEYPAPGDGKLAAEIASTLGGQVEERGFDHGTWVPLRFLYPEANVPVVQLSLPRTSHAKLRQIGAALAPFEDVLLVGSGGIVHNLRLLHWEDENAPVDEWARAFDEWTWENLGPGYDHATGPQATLAVPTTEHMDPLYVVLGAAPAGKELVHAGFKHGNLSMRTFSMERAASR